MSNLGQRMCRECGCAFEGGPRAWYCPRCRAKRHKAQHRTYRIRRSMGNVRHIGSLDICVRCGAEYLVCDPNQIYCPTCAPDAIKEIDKMQGLAYYHRNKDRLNPVRNERRRQARAEANRRLKNMDKAYMLGQLFALLESVGVISLTQLSVVVMCPSKYIGKYTAAAAQTTGYTEIEDEVARILNSLSPEDVTDTPASLDDQGKFFLGYYNQKKGKKRGAPLAENRIDWTTVDFSKGDAEIARELGVARQAVRSQRIRRASERKA